jgi:ATP-dependent Clp protease protease subunit
LNRILAENTGRTIEEVAIATERDNFLSAEEALDFGLIDKIIDAR